MEGWWGVDDCMEARSYSNGLWQVQAVQRRWEQTASTALLFITTACLISQDMYPWLRALAMQVVPFSPASGLLEWVEDTMPLADYLIGKNRTGGAHQRYQRPGDLNFYQARSLDCSYLLPC